MTISPIGGQFIAANRTHLLVFATLFLNVSVLGFLLKQD